MDRNFDGSFNSKARGKESQGRQMYIENTYNYFLNECSAKTLVAMDELGDYLLRSKRVDMDSVLRYM
jgi:hypothetical protein